MTLKDINTCIPADKLTIIVGEVASGKTTFCQALLGELPVSSGTVKTFTSSQRIAYCSQSPFLYNGTFRQNIIGHCAFDQRKNFVVEELVVLLLVDCAIVDNGFRDDSIEELGGQNLCKRFFNHRWRIVGCIRKLYA